MCHHAAPEDRKLTSCARVAACPALPLTPSFAPLGSGRRKPIVLTGSQLPLALPRSDARQNLLDSVCCATASFSPPHVNLQGERVEGVQELHGWSGPVCMLPSLAYDEAATGSCRPVICRGCDMFWRASHEGQPGAESQQQRVPGAAACADMRMLMCAPPMPKGWECLHGLRSTCNRIIMPACLPPQAFDSPNYPYLAEMGVDISWNAQLLLRVRPRWQRPPSRRLPVHWFWGMRLPMHWF